MLKVAILVLFASSGVGIVKHVLDQKAADKQRKSEQIAKWQEMLGKINFLRGKNVDATELIQRNVDFLALEPSRVELGARCCFVGQQHARDVGAAWG
jgi:hypothetical protein